MDVRAARPQITVKPKKVAPILGDMKRGPAWRRAAAVLALVLLAPSGAGAVPDGSFWGRVGGAGRSGRVVAGAGWGGRPTPPPRPAAKRSTSRACSNASTRRRAPVVSRA